jgi:hypothetical protein
VVPHGHLLGGPCLPQLGVHRCPQLGSNQVQVAAELVGAAADPPADQATPQAGPVLARPCGPRAGPRMLQQAAVDGPGAGPRAALVAACGLEHQAAARQAVASAHTQGVVVPVQAREVLGQGRRCTGVQAS